MLFSTIYVIALFTEHHVAQPASSSKMNGGNRNNSANQVMANNQTKPSFEPIRNQENEAGLPIGEFGVSVLI